MKNDNRETLAYFKNMNSTLLRVAKHFLLGFTAMLIAACGGGGGGGELQPGQPIVNRLSHSGITSSQCFQAGSNVLVACSTNAANNLNAQQDGHRASINPMSYSKLGFNGEVLAGSASSWCAVKDNVTGLLWQNHQGAPTTHTNFGDNRTGDASKYAADNATLCGLVGWRLPTVDELQSIVDYGEISPRINTTWFLNTPGNWYWSSSPSGFSAGEAWGVDFNGGYVDPSLIRTSNYSVRLVLANQ